MYVLDNFRIHALIDAAMAMAQSKGDRNDLFKKETKHFLSILTSEIESTGFE